MEGKVVALFLRSAHGQTPKAVARVKALAGHGIAEDLNSKLPAKSYRQALLTDTSDLSSLGLQPGDLREQIALDFPGLMALPTGARLRVGEALLQVTRDCEPCTHIGELVGTPDVKAFQKSLKGKRGMFTRVEGISGEGWIRAGDPVTVVYPAPAEDGAP